MNCRTHEHRRFERTLRPWGFYSEGHARPRVGAIKQTAGLLQRRDAVKASLRARPSRSGRRSSQGERRDRGGRAAPGQEPHPASPQERSRTAPRGGPGRGLGGVRAPRDVISLVRATRRTRVRGAATRPRATQSAHRLGCGSAAPERALASTVRPRIGRDYPLGLSILLSGGKETNKDSPSSCERTGKSPAPNPAGVARREMWC